jgi:ferrous iron transport protein B
VVTGLILKNTLFRGEPAPFIMELPPYHVPRFGSVLHHVWMRLRGFIVRAGKVIILVVALLGVLNSVGTDGSFGNEDSPESVLSALGKTITPVFGPMGIDRENWPATVGMFTGLFAKEAVVGTLNGLYGQIASRNAPEEGEADETEEAWSFAGEVGAAFMSIPEAFVGLGDTLRDPLGLSVVSGDEDETAESIEADPGLFTVMRGFFNNDKHAAYAYMLFILIYFPCVAALGALIREIGPLFGWVSVTYLTVLAWITATLYYQITVGHELVWIVTPFILFGMLIGAFALLRRAVQPEG